MGADQRRALLHAGLRRENPIGVTLPGAWLNQGTLPRVCATQGGPSIRLVKRTFVTKRPAWIYLLILLSLVVRLIVALAISTRSKALSPACRRAPRPDGSTSASCVRLGCSCWS